MLVLYTVINPYPSTLADMYMRVGNDLHWIAAIPAERMEDTSYLIGVYREIVQDFTRYDQVVVFCYNSVYKQD